LLHDPSLVRGYTALVERVGALAVTLLEYVRVLEETRVSRRRVVESESEQRLRLEKDLHDGAQQHLVALHIKLNLLKEELSGSQLEQRVSELSNDAYHAYEELTRIARGIYPITLAEGGLATAIRDVPMPPSIALNVTDGGIGRLPRAHEWAVYLAVIEAIQNATKHSHANTVSVAFDRVGRTCEVAIRDDGCGFEPATGGTGLTDIHDRIESIGGQVAIHSWLGGGTLVTLSIPRLESRDA
jgi:signal transduction histidine kinase